jgi:hypothetical protein
VASYLQHLCYKTLLTIWFRLGKKAVCRVFFSVAAAVVEAAPAGESEKCMEDVSDDMVMLVRSACGAYGIEGKMEKWRDEGAAN